jgi:hypothetical protein
MSSFFVFFSAYTLPSIIITIITIIMSISVIVVFTVVIRSKLSLQQCFSISVARQTVSHPILRHTDLEDLVFCNRAALFPCRYGKEAWIIDDY